MSVDAVIWHAPTYCWAPRRPKGSKHLRVIASTESSVYYNCLDHHGFMAQFDIEMTYRMCSQVPLHYFVDKYLSISPGKGIMQTPVDFDLKSNHLVWISSNCQREGAFSGRTRILKEVRDVARRSNATVQVVSLGKCEPTAPFPGGDKVSIMAKSKFCVAMENSIAQDYVTEKLWDALMAGCVPVYIGAPNIYDFLPDPNAIIHYGHGAIQTPEDLVLEMSRLATDKRAYEAKLVWKKHTREAEFPSSFQSLLAQTELHMPHPQCQLCTLVASARARPRTFTTCLWNSTWLQHAGRLAPKY